MLCLQMAGNIPQGNFRLRIQGKDLPDHRTFAVHRRIAVSFHAVDCNISERKTIRDPAAHIKAAFASGCIGICDALLDRFTLQLRKDHYDHEHRLPNRGGGIKLFHGTGKAHRVLLKKMNHIGKVEHGAADPVETVNNNPPDPAFGDVLHQPAEGRPVGVFSAVSSVGIDFIVTSRQFPYAEFRLAFHRYTVCTVDRLPCIDRLGFHGNPPKRNGSPLQSDSLNRCSAQCSPISGSMDKKSRTACFLFSV